MLIGLFHFAELTPERKLRFLDRQSGLWLTMLIHA
jgi:hypothetical protein